MVERTRTSLEELLSEAGWLRGLASVLVRADEADDLLQDTWLAALRTRPGAGLGLRAWLARVARNLALNRHRAGARRAEHEGALPPPEDCASPADLAQTAELHRLLADAITRLPEELRTVVVLHHLRGLDSRTVAAQLALSPSAVRTRLQRARAALRADLDQRVPGGRKAWVAWIFPLASSSVAPATGALVAGFVLTALIGGGWFGVHALLGRPTSAPVPEDKLSSLGRREPASIAESKASAAPSASPRSAVHLSSAAASPTGGAPEAVLAGRVLVDGGPPWWPLRISYSAGDPGDQGKSWMSQDLPPDRQGYFRFAVEEGWRGTVRIADDTVEEQGTALRLEAPRGDLMFELRSLPAIEGRIVFADGVAAGDVRCGFALTAFETDTVTGTRRSFFRTDGAGRFRIPILPYGRTAAVLLGLEDPRGCLRYESPRFAPSESLNLDDLVCAPVRTLDFFVRDGHGQALAGATAEVEQLEWRRASEATDYRGRGALAWLPSEAARVRFRCRGFVDRRLEVSSDLALEVQLERQAILELDLGADLERRTARFRLVSNAPAFVWDELGWEELSDDLEVTFQGVQRNRRFSSPLEFEYFFEDEMDLQGIAPGVPIEVSALAADGRVLRRTVVSLAAEETRRITWD